MTSLSSESTTISFILVDGKLEPEPSGESTCKYIDDDEDDDKQEFSDSQNKEWNKLSDGYYYYNTLEPGIRNGKITSSNSNKKDNDSICLKNNKYQDVCENERFSSVTNYSWAKILNINMETPSSGNSNSLHVRDSKFGNRLQSDFISGNRLPVNSNTNFNRTSDTDSINIQNDNQSFTSSLNSSGRVENHSNNTSLVSQNGIPINGNVPCNITSDLINDNSVQGNVPNTDLDPVLNQVTDLVSRLAEAESKKTRLQRERDEIEGLCGGVKRGLDLSESSSSGGPNTSSNTGEIVYRETRNNQSRPLTRYLPISDLDFNLTQFLESSGHDLSTSPDLIINPTSARGWLVKQGGRFKSWHRRWFVFDRLARYLTYYKDRGETVEKGSIAFSEIEDVFIDHLKQASKSPDPSRTFCVKTPTRTYYMVAPCCVTRQIWVDAIFTGAEGYLGFQ